MTQTTKGLPIFFKSYIYMCTYTSIVEHSDSLEFGTSWIQYLFSESFCAQWLSKTRLPSTIELEDHQVVTGLHLMNHECRGLGKVGLDLGKLARTECNFYKMLALSRCLHLQLWVPSFLTELLLPWTWQQRGAQQILNIGCQMVSFQ